MPRFTAKITFLYDDVTDPKMTKAKRNEILRDLVFDELGRIMTYANMPGEVLEVRKSQDE